MPRRQVLYENISYAMLHLSSGDAASAPYSRSEYRISAEGWAFCSGVTYVAMRAYCWIREHKSAQITVMVLGWT